MIVGGKIFKIEVDEYNSRARILEQNEKIFWRYIYRNRINGVKITSLRSPGFEYNTLFIRGFKNSDDYNWFSIPGNKIEDLCRIATSLNEETFDYSTCIGAKDVLLVQVAENKCRARIIEQNLDISYGNWNTTIDNIDVISLIAPSSGKDRIYLRGTDSNLDLCTFYWDNKFASVILKICELYNKKYWRV